MFEYLASLSFSEWMFIGIATFVIYFLSDYLAQLIGKKLQEHGLLFPAEQSDDKEDEEKEAGGGK